MTTKRKRQLEHLLRTARQRAYDNDRWGHVIIRCKRRLGLDRPGRDLVKERWAETMGV